LEAPGSGTVTKIQSGSKKGPRKKRGTCLESQKKWAGVEKNKKRQDSPGSRVFLQYETKSGARQTKVMVRKRKGGAAGERGTPTRKIGQKTRCWGDIRKTKKTRQLRKKGGGQNWGHQVAKKGGKTRFLNG